MNRTLGIGRLLIAAYGVFAISASARAGFQLATKFAEAPLAYSLSALSAIVYVFAAIALAKSGQRWHVIAWIAVTFELIGVVAIGSLSLLFPSIFNHPTVWSGFGAGYGYFPAILPILGIAWLRKAGN